MLQSLWKGGGGERGGGESGKFYCDNQNPPTRSVLFIKSAESSETGLETPVYDFLIMQSGNQFSFRNF